MAHFVFRVREDNEVDLYLTHRRATGQQMYHVQAQLTSSLSEARVFTTKAAATNSGGASGEIVEVELVVKHK